MRSLLVACLACGCGGAQHQEAHDDQAFACRGRTARYVAAHHMAGAELGVELTCQGGPQIRRWRRDREGNGQRDAHRLTAARFDAIWRDIDATGWTNLRDCRNGTNGKQDPLYQFTIQDDQNRGAFQCRSRSMPFPYSAIVDPMDLAAQDGRGQLGDDDPAAVPARDARGPRK